MYQRLGNRNRDVTASVEETKDNAVRKEAVKKGSCQKRAETG